MVKRAAILLAGILLLLAGCSYEPTRITVVNGLGSWDIEYFYISDTDEEDWGRNSLTRILTPGDSLSIAVEKGTYDLHAIDQDGDTYTLWDQRVPEEGFRWEITLDQID